MRASANLLVFVTSRALRWILSEPRKLGNSKPMPDSFSTVGSWKPCSAWSTCRVEDAPRDRVHNLAWFFVSSSASAATRHLTYIATCSDSKKILYCVMLVVWTKVALCLVSAWSLSVNPSAIKHYSSFGELVESLGQITMMPNRNLMQGP